MRLFLYYASHSFINGMKKLLKTWVAIFLVLMVFGGIVGFVIGSLIPDDDDKKTSAETSTTETTVQENDENDDIISFSWGEDGDVSFLEKHGISKYELTDMIVAMAFFLVIAMNIATSKNAGNIFQPGDVPMLFASPMKPQSVMLFRLMGQMGMSVIMSLFMLFQLPNLINSAKFSVWGSISLIIAYAFLSVLGALIQVTFYTITSNMKGEKKSITTWLIVFFAILAGSFLAYKYATNDSDWIHCACRFFANKHTFWVPFWGWIRGFCFHALAGDVAKSLIYLLLFVLGCVAVIVFIWKMKADFYEDAIGAAEKKAELFENAKRAASGGVMTRTKERKNEKLERDGFKFGSGASVFFFKPIYNRLRFGILKIFSKTSIVFTLVAGFAAYMARSYDKGNGFFIPVIALTVLMFYRTLGNSLQEDTSREFFVLIPDSPFLKMWYSLLGSMIVNLIDLILPMIVAEAFLLENPLVVVGWLLFILSVSFFGTVVGTFINVSLPQNAGQNIKAMVQIVFLYFGMMPSVGAIIFGVLAHCELIAIPVGAIVNIGIGTLFCCFTPHFLTNK